MSKRLVQRPEKIYFGHQFASKTAFPGAVSDEAVKVYVDAVKASPAGGPSRSSCARSVCRVTGVVLPGVGHWPSTMRTGRETHFPRRGKPVTTPDKTAHTPSDLPRTVTNPMMGASVTFLTSSEEIDGKYVTTRCEEVAGA